MIHNDDSIHLVVSGSELDNTLLLLAHIQIDMTIFLVNMFMGNSKLINLFGFILCLKIFGEYQGILEVTSFPSNSKAHFILIGAHAV